MKAILLMIPIAIAIYKAIKFKDITAVKKSDVLSKYNRTAGNICKSISKSNHTNSIGDKKITDAGTAASVEYSGSEDVDMTLTIRDLIGS